METSYTRLGLSEGATPEQIRKVRRVLAREHHPDRHGGSAEKEALFKQINADADELLDPARRTALDDRLAEERARIRASAAASHAAAATPPPTTAAKPARPTTGRDPMKVVWGATPFETIVAAAMANRPASDVWSSVARGAGKGADLAWKAWLASQLHLPATPQQVTRPSTSDPSRTARCKATKNDGRGCQNSPLYGNYGFCGVHR
jgi:curved DNA-binding protein CbpA